MDPATAFARLDDAWEPIAERWRRASGPVELLFSGGVDSGLLAWELRGRADLSLTTVGTLGARDVEAARAAGVRLGLPWRTVTVGDAELRAVALRTSDRWSDVPAARRSIFVSLALAIASTGPSEVLLGQGADELFLGYAHFRGLGPAEAAARSVSDLRQLRSSDWPRTQSIAEEFGRRVAAPFLEPEFVAAAAGLPVELRMPDPEPKSLFRRWAVHRGLPTELAARPKRALQFGSGVDRLWRHTAEGARGDGPTSRPQSAGGRPAEIE